jgi:hypothetical protein
MNARNTSPKASSPRLAAPALLAIAICVVAAHPSSSSTITPSAGGCVSVTKLDATGTPLPDGSPVEPASARFSGVAGHFSTWVVVLAKPYRRLAARYLGRAVDGAEATGFLAVETEVSAPSESAIRGPKLAGFGARSRGRTGENDRLGSLQIDVENFKLLLPGVVAERFEVISC